MQEGCTNCFLMGVDFFFFLASTVFFWGMNIFVPQMHNYVGKSVTLARVKCTMLYMIHIKIKMVLKIIEGLCKRVRPTYK